MLPSPTAAATRFTGPKRTSPHAKMPGTHVSSRYGSRSSGQRPAARISEPVSTKPRLSSAISGGSHAVWASAPMKMNIPDEPSRVVSPVSRLRTSIACSERSPRTARISVLKIVRMFGRVPIWSTRYCDMLFSRLSPRQRIVTLRAWVEKNSAACPAELPAPTMWMSWPWVFGASLRAAPYEMPFPVSRSNPSAVSFRQATPQAMMIVFARRTSPPSR